MRQSRLRPQHRDVFLALYLLLVNFILLFKFFLFKTQFFSVKV